MKDPFGIQQQKVVLSANGNDSVPEVVKKEEKVDLVKIYLAAVKPLEVVKDDLQEISERVQDEAVKAKVEGFTASSCTLSEISCRSS